MSPLEPILARLDLDPVVVGLLAVLLALRGAIVLSLRERRRRVRRMTVRPTPSLREQFLERLDVGLVVILLAFLVIRPFVLQVTDVRSTDMAPTLHGGLTPQMDGPYDRVVVNKLLFHLRAPRRGEVVFYQRSDAEEASRHRIQRVLALPGDTVEIDQDGVLLINGQPQPEPYLAEVTNRVFPPRQVPPGEYFTLGDNRNADDAGYERPAEPFLPHGALRGKVVAVWWPPERARLLTPDAPPLP